MALIAIFPLLMIGTVLAVFTMIMNDEHVAHHNYIPVVEELYEEELLAA
jgi:hypothetical protein